MKLWDSPGLLITDSFIFNPAVDIAVLTIPHAQAFLFSCEILGIYYFAFKSRCRPVFQSLCNAHSTDTTNL